ncbi:MAG: PH domain-containing protein [Muribaculaceae bacterium]|nr:PH domain-containing protein [Muribaculaceae bacterium]
MKSKITYSRFVNILTYVVTVVLFVGCIATVKNETAFFLLLGIFLILYVFSLFMGPAYIKTDNDNIVLGSLLRGKKLPMSDVESVELFQPTMGALRLCASGGFMGYWGIFREADIGIYYGFYGKASDCFLIRMKNGDKYVLGCDQPDRMVDYIKSRIQK